MSDAGWYYTNGDDRKGPVPMSTLEALAEAGVVGPDTRVWSEGMADWESAHRHVRGVVPPLPSSVPPVRRAAPPPAHGAPGAGHDYTRPVGMREAARLFFTNYATFSGRSNRGGFWWWALLSLIVGVVLGSIDATSMDMMQTSPLASLWSLVTLVPTFALGCRRLHDIDRSGWWQLIALIPLVGWVILLVWYATAPDPRPNRFG